MLVRRCEARRTSMITAACEHGNVWMHSERLYGAWQAEGQGLEAAASLPRPALGHGGQVSAQRRLHSCSHLSAGDLPRGLYCCAAVHLLQDDRMELAHSYTHFEQDKVDADRAQ